METTSKLQYGEIVPLMSHVNQIPRPTTLHLYPGHVHRSVQTYGSAATRRHCRPVHFRSLPVRTSKRRTHQLPATALDTGELQGRESLALYSQGNIFSARRERVFTVRYARTKQTKKKHKTPDTPDKSASVLIIWKMFGQVSGGAAVRRFEAPSG